MRFLRAFGRFWLDFIVGDDWRIAAGVTLVLAAGAALVVAGLGSTVAPLVAGGIIAVLFIVLTL
jgi:hypothetical protein